MADTETRRRRPNGAKKIYILIGLPLAILGLVYGLRFAVTPWSVSLPGKPALTGYWQGQVSFTPGDTRRLVLHLTVTSPDCGACKRIHGNIKVCGGEHDMSSEVGGDTHNYLGTRFSLDTATAEDRPGVYLDTVDGQWQGNLLRMHAELTVVDPDGSISSNHQLPDPPMFEMHRSDKGAFSAAC